MSDTIRVVPIPTVHAEHYWSAGTDAYGNTPETQVSDGSEVPCRHCLTHVGSGDAFLILAYRPFRSMQPYAESGPIFLHAEPCDGYRDSSRIPLIYLRGESRIVRAYDHDERIVYGTGKVVAPGCIASYANQLLEDPQVAFVHVRSSENNCYAFRIDRAVDDT